MTTVLRRWGLVFFGLVTACVTRDERPPSKLAEGCLLNSDCEANLVCVFRRCYQQCTTDRDCPQPDGRCQAGEPPYAVCIEGCADRPCPTGFTCGTDRRCRKGCGSPADCLVGQSCVSGQCVSPLDVVDGGAPVGGLCVIDSQCPAREVCRRNGTCGPQCMTARDCESGQSCESGLCSLIGAGPSCLYNSDCDAGVCRLGACGVECRTERDCAGGAACMGERCQGSQGGGCVFNTDCPVPGEVCLGGACRPECRTIRDCQAGAECQNGSCVRPGRLADGGACLYTSECPVGQLCRSGACQPECLRTLDCGGGLACIGGQCVVPLVDGGASTSRCLYSSDCATGQRCSPTGLCIAECRDAVDCGRGQLCVAGACRFPGNDGGLPCVYTSQCAAGQRCTPSGQCAPECLDSRDCTQPRVCVNGACSLPLPDTDGGFPGLGTACVLQSTCVPFGLVCGPGGSCVFQCAADQDCAVAQGQCCRGNRCQAGVACVVAPDAGTRDAGTVPLDGGCRATIDCLDADFCNGEERCVGGRCLAGTNPCDDGNPCTIDACSNSNRQCSYSTQAIDADGDGRFPRSCGGSADDCDDADPQTFPGALERCDFKDNNCNGGVDEGLWVEVSGARGSFTTGSSYPPAGNPVAIARSGDDVVVAAGSSGVRGSIDAYRLSAQDFSLVSGPVVLQQSTTPWASCFAGGPIAGQVAGRPTAVSNGSEVVITGITGNYSNPQATCLTNDVYRVRSTASFTTGPLASPVNQLISETTPLVFSVTSLFNPVFTDLDRASLAFSPTLGRYVAVWAEERPANFNSTPLPRTLLFTTVSRTQTAGTAREVWSLAPPATAVAVPSITFPPRVAVGRSTVLFAWTNDAFQPFVTNARLIRWVLYDASLTSTLAPPTLYTGSGWTTLTGPRVDSAFFDGTNYVLVISNNDNVTPARLLTVSETGALVGDRPLTLLSSTTSQAVPTFQHSAFVSFNPDGGAPGYGVIGANQTSLRLITLPAVLDGGLNVLDVDLQTPITSRSDFAAVALDGLSVGVVWTDGDLRKTVLRCGP